MIAARAVRANSLRGSEAPTCPRRCFAFIPYKRSGRGRHDGRTVVGRHTVIVDRIFRRRATMMAGRIVGTAGEPCGQHQYNQQNAVHRLSKQNDNNGNEAPRVYLQFAFDDVAAGRVTLLPLPFCYACPTIEARLRVIGDCHGR